MTHRRKYIAVCEMQHSLLLTWFVHVSLAVLDNNGDDEQKGHNAVLTQDQSPSVSVSDQTEMNTISLGNSEYESMHETTHSGTLILLQ